MNSRAIVTLSDSNYFDLLLELIDSIKNYNEDRAERFVKSASKYKKISIIPLKTISFKIKLNVLSKKNDLCTNWTRC